MSEDTMMRWAILKVLQRTKGVLLPEGTLVNEVKLMVPRATTTEIRTHLSQFESERVIISGKMLLSTETGYRISAMGETVLAEAQNQ